MKQSYEAFLDGRHSRRLKNENRAIARLDAQHERANTMIGELSTGTLYIYPDGGKYREGTRAELIDFLIRNHYV
jgi:hypothetical protein